MVELRVISGLLHRGLPRLLRTGVVLLAGSLLIQPAAAQVPSDLSDLDATVVVDSIVVKGSQLFAEAALRGTIGIPTDQPITYQDVQDGQRRLWATGQFRDIQVTARGGDGEPVVLTFWVEEHPIVRRYTIEGLQSLSSQDVWDHAGMEVGEPYSPSRMVDARQFIVAGLVERGIPFAQVEERLIPVEGALGAVDVVLEVVEGQRVTIADLVFHGNTAFQDSELRDVLTTRREGFLWFRSGAYRDEDVQQDLAGNLPEFYAANGYLDFQVVSDTLIIDPTSGKARLEVEISEGPQYRMADFSIVGNRVFPVQDLEPYFTSQEGGLLRSLGLRRSTEAPEDRVFDQVAFQEATARVEELYRNSGYLYAQVSPILERMPPDSENGDPTVAVGWNIQEGQPAYIRRIIIEGNDYTHDRVIRERIVLLPGDVYSEERVLRSYQAISGLGFFETPLPIPDIRPDEQTGDLDIVFTVEERQTGTLNFGTTMGGYSGLAGFIGYDQPNLFGQARSGSLRWDFGSYQNSFQVQYTDPMLRGSRVSGTVSLFNARDRFFSFATGERKRRGITTRLGFPIPGSFYGRFYLGYSLSRTEYRLRDMGVDDTSLFGRPPGTQSQVTVGVARNTIDHPIFPTVGSQQSWTAEFNGGILGGDGSYTKHQVESTWWVPVGTLGGDGPGSRPLVFTLGVRARAGSIFGDAEAFPFDRFWMGGVQFGESLRGYQETTVTPIGFVPRGSGQVPDIARLGNTFLKVGAEYAVRFSDMVSLSAFYEAGNVWRHPQEIDPSRMFRGAGIGAQMMTPFGPIGIDLAYGFDRLEPGWELHFNMGQGQGGF